MRTPTRSILFCLFVFLLSAISPLLRAQSNAGSINGVITDPSGAVVPGATVSIENPVSQYARSTTTDSAGHYSFPNLPFNPYHLIVRGKGFASSAQDVDVRSAVQVVTNVGLKLGSETNTVIVTGSADLVEDDPTFHTDVDRSLFQKVPLESQSSSLSSLVTLASPGVAADSNGLFHGLGDHASNSFSIDGQSITDQQSKVFSNQLPTNAVQSLEVISGAPPAEFGGKTSLVIVATTRSGQGVTTPTGGVYASYGSFGSATGGIDLSYGQKNWGNFFEFDGLNTGRFLDPPEFTVFHDKGNEENAYDRVDYNFTPGDSVHLDLNYSRSWFQTPNAFDNLNVQNVVSDSGASATPVFGNVGNTDQRSKIETFNIYPTYTRIIGNNAVFNLGAWARKDLYNYFPSAESSCRPGRSKPANLIHFPDPFPSEYRGSHRLFVCEGASTISKWAPSMGKPSCVKATSGHRREHLQLTLFGPQRQPPARIPRSDGLHRAGSDPERELRSGAGALRPDSRRYGVLLLRPYGRKGAGSLHRGSDQGPQLALQPWHAR